MRLFCFASKNELNILLGVKHKMWAVATTSESDQITRRSKARKNVHIGDFGLLYCNTTHSFVVPFIFESKPDLWRVELEIWPEPWILPFRIAPLGDGSRRVSGEEAAERWSVAKRRFQSMRSRRGGIPAAMHITGTTVFVPLEITADDWREILDDLST